MYQRQQLFLGKSAQDKLFRSKVVLIGCGALGSNIGTALARAGIGEITVIDRDLVEEENLGTHNYSYSEIGLPKAVALKENITCINRQIKVNAVVADVNSKNIEGLIKGKDLVIDGTDNFQTRFLINDACVKNKMPWIYGSCVKSIGSIAIFYSKGPCFCCVFPRMPGRLETCDTAGIVSALPSTIAGIQVAEAIKLLIGRKTEQNMIFYDCVKQTLDKVALKKNGKCKACSKHSYEFLKSKMKETAVMCGKSMVQISPKRPLEIRELINRLQNADVEIIGGNLYLMSFKVKGYVITVFEDGRALVKGTSDEKTAKSLYSKYIGN